MKLTWENTKRLWQSFADYQFCVLQSPSVLSKEKRIAKVCWNENDWISPSGEFGKSNDGKIARKRRGYGHEEWLFDLEISWRLSLCLLQPVQKGRGQLFSIKVLMCDCIAQFRHEWKSLGRFNQKTLKRFQRWCERIYSHYRTTVGWMKWRSTLISQRRCSHFRKFETAWMFNVRFNPEYAKLDSHTESRKLWRTIGTYHYQFVRDKDQASKLLEKRQAEKL